MICWECNCKYWQKVKIYLLSIIIIIVIWPCYYNIRILQHSDKFTLKHHIYWSYISHTDIFYFYKRLKDEYIESNSKPLILEVFFVSWNVVLHVKVSSMLTQPLFGPLLFWNLPHNYLYIYFNYNFHLMYKHIKSFTLKFSD